MKRLLMLFAAVAALGWLSTPREARGGDFLYGCIVPGADAGTTAKLTITGGYQFMVNCPTYAVNYLVCVDAGCTATSTSAPIPSDQQVDLCAPSGYTTLSLYKGYDGGNPSCCVYKVVPRTVCQSQ